MKHNPKKRDLRNRRNGHNQKKGVLGTGTTQKGGGVLGAGQYKIGGGVLGAGQYKIGGRGL